MTDDERLIIVNDAKCLADFSYSNEYWQELPCRVILFAGWYPGLVWC